MNSLLFISVLLGPPAPTPKPPSTAEDAELQPEPQTDDSDATASDVRDARPVRLVPFMTGGTVLVSRPPYMTPSIGDRNLGMFSVGVRASVRLGASRFDVGGGLAYRRVIGTGDIYREVFDVEVIVNEPVVFGRGGVMLVKGLDAYVELGGGPSVVTVGFEGQGSAEQRRVVGMFHGMAGLSIIPAAWMPRRWTSRFRAGIDLGLGYAARGAVAVRLVPDGDDSIRARPTPLGEAALGGLMWRAGGFLEFALGRSRTSGSST